VIAFAIEKTIGLRVSAEEEEHLDLSQQGMSAYQEGPTPPDPTADGATVSAAPKPLEPGNTLYLVTAVLDSGGAAGVEREVLAAGARRAMLSEVFVTTASSVDQMVRGQKRTMDVTPRVRAEILTPAESLTSVRSALSALGDDLVEMTVVPVESG